MLTLKDPTAARLATPPVGAEANQFTGAADQATPGRLAKMLKVEWLGQTIASLCWIASVFAYGEFSQSGDWLQLAAASAWLVANLAAVAGSESD